MTLRIYTAKDYANIFGISYASAKRWLQDDLEMLNRKKITDAQFNCLYRDIEPLKIPQVYKPNNYPQKKRKGLKVAQSGS